MTTKKKKTSSKKPVSRGTPTKKKAAKKKATRKASQGNSNADKRRNSARQAVRDTIDGKRELRRLDEIYNRALVADVDEVPGLALAFKICQTRLDRVIPKLRTVEHKTDAEVLPVYQFIVPK